MKFSSACSLAGTSSWHEGVQVPGGAVAALVQCLLAPPFLSAPPVCPCTFPSTIPTFARAVLLGGCVVRSGRVVSVRMALVAHHGAHHGAMQVCWLAG